MWAGLKAPPWDNAFVLSVLPHKFPFVLVDRVLELDPVPNMENWTGRKIRAMKNVTYNENFFPGHFPDFPVMPGALILEALAQASVLLSARPAPPNVKYEFRLVTLDGVKFRKAVVPGDRLELCSIMTRDRKTKYQFETHAEVDGVVVAEANIFATMMPRPLTPVGLNP